jgi:cytochrome c-type biogenesis protein CcmF
MKKKSNLSQKISHLGFSLFILSIIFNGIYSKEIITNIKVGEKYEFQSGSIYFEKTKNFKKENYLSIIGTFIIKEDNSELYLKPELRIFHQPVIITSEADIKTTLFSDKFLVMNLIKGDDFYNIRYQTKPFMIWIWLSVIMLVIGGFVNLITKKIK